MTTRSAIRRLLRPKSVAIVGASPTPGSLGNGVLANLDRFGYAGAIHLINPTREEIGGRPCLKTTDDLPHGVDCAVLAIPRAGVLAALEGCARRGVGGAIVFASGFAEQGDEGRALQAEIVRIARDSGMSIEGPNCLGMVNLVDGVPLTFGATEVSIVPKDARAVAIVSQSGAMASVVRAALLARGVAVSISVSTGNEAVNGIEDFVEDLIDDPRNQIIALVVEQFRRPQQFLALAAKARAAGKIIVVLHPGRSAAARKSAETHTGALTGDYQVMRALVTRAGASVVETLEELIDLSEIHARARAPVQPGVALITDSGAFKGLVLDLCESVDLALPEPGPEASASIGSIAPDLIFATNPLDLTAMALVDPDLYRKTMGPLIADERFGAIVLAVIISNPSLAIRKVEPIIKAIREFDTQKLIVFAMLGEDAEVPQVIVDDLRALHVPFFRSPERALRALAAINRHVSAVASQQPLMTAPQALPSGVLAEHVAKQIFAGVGIPVPRGELARSIDDAVAIAARVGYPVALKAQSADLSHKSDAGGVVLNVANEQMLRDAWKAMHEALHRVRPGLRLDGVLVEAMSMRGLELIVGARRDPEWGPVVVVGLGGVFTEALHDVRVLAPDLSEDEIEREFYKLRGAAMLGAFRGAPPRDVKSAARVAAQIGAFISAHPQVTEIDINPLMAFEVGKGVMALDALIVTERQ
jgi:acyl-CoA synthetase (NDP forming)